MSLMKYLTKHLMGSLVCAIALSTLLASAIATAAPNEKNDPKISPTIDRLRVEPGSSPSVGPKDAPVTVIEFLDYQCGYCAKAHKTVGELRAKYPKQIRVVYKHHPLSFHKDAPLAARAALAADIQGKFDDMHEMLLQNRAKLKRGDLLRYATQLGFDIADFRSMIDSEGLKGIVDDDTAVAQKIGATGTPFFLVNGRPLSGAQPRNIFERVIDEELSGKLRTTRWIERWKRPERKEHVHGPNCKHGNTGGVDARLAKQFTSLNNELRQLRLELGALRREVSSLRRELKGPGSGVSQAELTRFRATLKSLSKEQRKEVQAALNGGN